MATDTLFEQHSVKEIQDIEKNLRNDIERKKEELRQMVGERYRDLMEAADTITEMKLIAEDVSLRVRKTETNCSDLKHSSIRSGIMNSVNLKVTQRKKMHENLYAVAALIKVLIDSPAKIWGYIEREDYLSAFQLYTMARHTHSLLVLDEVYRKQGILTNFPVINKQWTSMRHFQHILLQKSREKLMKENICAEEVVGPLSCILFLSDTSVERVLEEFLLSRKIAVSNIFRPEKAAKTQVCELLDVLHNALKVIHTIFHPGVAGIDNCRTNLLSDTIHLITSTKFQGPVSLLDQNSLTYQYLPDDVTGYRPSLKTAFCNINVNHLKQACDKWITEVNNELKIKLKDLLNYIFTIKGLALIKEAVLERMEENSSFDIVCEQLLGKRLSVWEFFLQDTFMERIKVIINDQVSQTIQDCSNSVEEVYKKIENQSFNETVASYVWLESESDLAPNLGWSTHHQRQLWDGGTLGIKAYALMPNVQCICFGMDKKLSSLLEDVSHCSPKKLSQEEQWRREHDFQFAEQTAKDSESELEDFKSIHSHLTCEVHKHLLSLCEHIETNLQAWENADSTVPSKLVFTGHLCNGLTKLCPHVIQCLTISGQGQFNRQLSSAVSGISKDEQLWQLLKTKLLELSDKSFRIWSRNKVQELVNNFDRQLILSSGTGILQALLWDKVEIQEESEEGNTVKSTLKLPQQISIPLYKSIFMFCWELNNIGGYSICSAVKSEIQELFFCHLLRTYQKKVDEPWADDVFTPHLKQTQSLQCLFDVQFLVGLMGTARKTDDNISHISKDIISKLVAHIDPFDMDVFSPHIQSNLRKTLQRSSLLFGLATSSEQISHLNSLKTSLSSGQIDHNLMLMPSGCARLPLLPHASHTTSKVTSMTDSTRNISISQASPLKSSSHSSSPNLRASDSSSAMMKSSSFYDRVTAMSSSWFGGN